MCLCEQIEWKCKWSNMNCQSINKTLRADLTAANKNVACRRFSPTFQLFRQLLFCRRPGFLQFFASTLSTTCLSLPALLILLHFKCYTCSQMFKFSNVQTINFLFCAVQCNLDVPNSLVCICSLVFVYLCVFVFVYLYSVPLGVNYWWTASR